MDYKSTTLFTRDERTLDFKRLAAEKIDLKGAPTPINESLVLDLNDIGFFTAPASVSYHGNKEGGLYDHSRAVADKLIDMTILFCLFYYIYKYIFKYRCSFKSSFIVLAKR